LKLKELDICMMNKKFNELDLNKLDTSDLVYCDPPYLITTGSYNDGKRGFTGWGDQEELNLLNILDSLTTRRIKFALSNVLVHKGLTNNILLKWLDFNNYYLTEVDNNFNNSNYQSRKIGDTREVFITNYNPLFPNLEVKFNEAKKGQQVFSEIYRK
jgi:DNA adenine methylase